MHRTTIALAILFIALVISGCGGDEGPEASPPAESPDTSPAATRSAAPTASASASPSASATAEATATSDATSATAGMSARPATLYGIAGLVPPNFPDSTDADWLEFFATLPALGGTVGNYSQLTDLAQNQEVGLAAGLNVLPVTGFHQDAAGGLEVTINFADPVQRAAFIHDLVDFAEEYQPPYLGVGNEVNRVWEADPAAFDAWVAALPEIVDAVHEASPTTQVFATFQYEFLVGRDVITGQQRAEDWTPLEAAAPHLDLVAFTSYPYFAYDTPDEVPDDYYAGITEHTDRPIGFSELGWPSAPIEQIAGSPLEGLGGTPDEQTEFIKRLGVLLARVQPRFAMWVWAYDTLAVDPTFQSLGLSSAGGEAKPSLDAWQSFIGAK